MSLMPSYAHRAYESLERFIGAGEKDRRRGKTSCAARGNYTDEFREIN